MKIVLTDCATVTNGDLDLTVLERFGEVVYNEQTPPEKLAETIRGADAVICNKTVISGEVMRAVPTLKYIGLFATGYNNIDIEAAKELGIAVCNAGEYSTNAVAQHVFALLLELCCSTSGYIDFTGSGGWKSCKTFSGFGRPQYELFGKTMGIFGYGSIGRAVAKIADSFGMKVLAHTRSPKPDEIAEMVSFEQLLARSDVISVHCPLTPQTERIFSEAAFEQCKQECIFINTSRGGVVDEPALRSALESGRLRAAAVDVLTEEPMSESCCLLGAPNLIITPHVAWSPIETRRRLMDIVVGCLDAFDKGERLNRIV